MGFITQTQTHIPDPLFICGDLDPVGSRKMLLPEGGLFATPPAKEPLVKDLENMKVAIQQARLGFKEGGVPIGGALVGAYI